MTGPQGALSVPLVSIVITTLNRQTLLVDAIDSVLAQTFVDWELVIVDDGSEPPVVLSDERAADPRIRLLRNETNQGISTSRNTALEASRGSYVAFLDDDDEWLPTKLESQVTLLVGAPDSAGMVRCAYEMRSHDNLEFVSSGPRRFDLRSEMLRSPAIAPSTVLLRRSVLDDVGGFDDALEQMEDWDLFLRVSDSYGSISQPEALVLRQRHAPTDPRILLTAYRVMMSRVRPRLKAVPTAERVLITLRHRGWITVRLVEVALRTLLGAGAWEATISFKRKLRRSFG